jgi:Fur family transcriptional regulator, iron response regulator
MKTDLLMLLRKHAIQPSAQRVAVARYVLDTCEHPTADKVWAKVKRAFPMISRATVYNTLKLFVRKGLLRQFVLNDGKTVFDANVGSHHHFVDEASGRLYDIP